MKIPKEPQPVVAGNIELAPPPKELVKVHLGKRKQAQKTDEGSYASEPGTHTLPAPLVAQVGAKAVVAAEHLGRGLARLAELAFQPLTVHFGAVASAGGARDAKALQGAMDGVVTASWALADAVKALKAAPDNEGARAAFSTCAAALDAAKARMLAVGASEPDKRVLFLDTTDAVEVGHGKPAATTKLAFAVQKLTGDHAFARALKGALKLDEAGYARAVDAALRASEWTTLGELAAPSAVLAFPGPPDGAGRAVIVGLPAENARLARALGLLAGEPADALEQHLRYTGKESAGAQILGVIRMLSSLVEKRDFRTQERLGVADVQAALLQNARAALSGAPEPKVDAALVSALQPALAHAIDVLR